MFKIAEYLEEETRAKNYYKVTKELLKPLKGQNREKLAKELLSESFLNHGE